MSRSDWSRAKKHNKKGRKDNSPKDSAAQLTADIEQDFPYESDNIDNSHNRDLDTDI
ncbi:MAG: hypothetical protein ABGY10_03675 [bacterium]